MREMAPPVDADALLAERIRVLYGIGRQTAWSNTLAALAVVAVAWVTAEPFLLIAWFAAILANAAMRLASFWLYRRRGGATVATARAWGACYATLSLIVGLTWGIGLALLLRQVSPTQEVMLLIIATATVVGGVATSVLFWAHAAYNIGLMSPVAIGYALRGHEHDWLLAPCILAFIVMALGLARTVGGSIARGLRLGLENAALVKVLAAARAEAEAANLAKSRFLANIGHELRTPLNAILGFSELMRDGKASPEAMPRWQGFARDIHDSGERLLAIINDLLDMARLEAGRYVLHEAKVDVAEVLAGCLAAVREPARQGDVALDVSLPGDLPHLRADPRAVRQVLLNLLTNAVKFTPAGGRVEVNAAARDDGGLRITVRDSGIGIGPEHRALVFEPFRQVEMEFDRRYGGTGLGLPISKLLMELHGGGIALDSVLGSGTVVTVWFPVERVLGGVSRP